MSRLLSALPARDRRALALGAMLLAPMFAYAAIVRPYRSALDDARRQLQEERELLSRERRLVADAPSFPARRESAGRFLGATWTHIARGADTTSIAASVARTASEAAEDAGLQVEQVESRASDSTRRGRFGRGGLVPSTVELRARGDLDRVVRFLAAVESGDAYVSVDRLSIVSAPPPADAPDQETLEISVTMTGIARLLVRPAAFYAGPALPPRPHSAPVEAIRPVASRWQGAP